MRRAFALSLALLLLPAASAEAKFSVARVCGASDCREVTFASGHELMTMERVAFSAESRLGASPPQASPWYRVTLCPERCGSPGAMALRVLPSVGYAYLPPKVWAEVTGDAYPPREAWAQLSNRATEVYRRVTACLEPLPASGLLSVRAAAPNPRPGEQPGSIGPADHGGIPAWEWLVIAAAVVAAALALIALRRVRRRPSPPPG
jgi:hypothetical protein